MHVDGSKNHTPAVSAAALQHMLRNMIAPSFSGRMQDWNQFKVEWEIYITKVSAALKLDDECKMKILERAMDPVNQMDMQCRRMEKGKTLKYSEELSRLESKYGRDQSLWLRKSWEENSVRTKWVDVSGMNFRFFSSICGYK